MKRLGLISKLIQRYGFTDGIRLYSRFKLNNFNNLNIPGIQFGISLRRGTSDINAFSQVFLHQEYKTVIDESSNVFRRQDSLVIVDGGANIGMFTLLMKNHYPSATIICIEPDPENFQLLQQNVSKYKNVICENAGLWNKNTMLKVYDKYNYGKWAMVVEENQEEGNIKAIDIDSLLEKHQLNRIDILKLDIETSEKVLFAENYQHWLPKTKMLVVELHDWMEVGTSKPFFEAINKTFNRYKYSLSGENTVIVNFDLP